ncbi:MAG TPA: hypothetical protein VK944_03590 [Candidatus Limnocylindria bacterium]|nr:hypothetical protein [Candidatus Limnocylindria bacterium]
MRKSPTVFAVGMTIAVGVFLLAGCASFPPPKEAIPNSRVYGYGYDDVWESVLATLSGLNIPVKSMEKESGNIVAEDETIELRQYEPGRYDSIYCFCGSPEGYHVLKELVGAYTISVSRGTDVRTSVNIDVSFQASQYFGERVTGRFPCLSKGIFEPIFLERLDSQLATRREPSRREPSRNLDWWKPRREY